MPLYKLLLKSDDNGTLVALDIEAERSIKDQYGNVIDTTYALKSDVVNVVANPTVSGGEATLASLQVGNTKYVIPAGSAQQQADWNQTNVSAVDYIKNKPNLSDYVKETVTDASDNSSNIYNQGDKIDLLVYDENFNEASISIDVSSGISLMLGTDNAFSKIDITDKIEIQTSQILLSKDMGSTWSEVATKDDIPAAVRYDTNAQGLSSTQQSNARTNIGAGTSNFSGAYNDLSGKPSLATVATTGNYNDLSNKPSIPAVKYTHNVILFVGSSYAFSFSFRNTTSSAYTTPTEVRDALSALGYNADKKYLIASGKEIGYPVVGVTIVSGAFKIMYVGGSGHDTVFRPTYDLTFYQDFVVAD